MCVEFLIHVEQFDVISFTFFFTKHVQLWNVILHKSNYMKSAAFESDEFYICWKLERWPTHIYLYNLRTRLALYLLIKCIFSIKFTDISKNTVSGRLDSRQWIVIDLKINCIDLPSSIRLALYISHLTFKANYIVAIKLLWFTTKRLLRVWVSWIRIKNGNLPIKFFCCCLLFLFTAEIKK